MFWWSQILQPLPPLVASPVLLSGYACQIITLIRSSYIKRHIQKDTNDSLCIRKFWETPENRQKPYQSIRGPNSVTPKGLHVTVSVAFPGHIQMIYCIDHMDSGLNNANIKLKER